MAKRAWLSAWRLAVLAGIALLAARLHDSATVRPVTRGEVIPLLPSAARVLPVAGPLGHTVLDERGDPAGHALRTAPHGDVAIGYAGPTDVLVVLDAEGRIAGAAIRSSSDTPGHVASVAADEGFWQQLGGRSWQAVAGARRRELGIDGVAGATRTSEAVVDAISARLAYAERAALPRGRWRVTRNDLALVLALGVGLWMAWSPRARRRWRRLLQLFVVGWIGLLAGDLLALSLADGWLRSGLPWRAAPGLVLLAAAAVLVPATSGRPVYCAHLCAHGILQEWLTRLPGRKTAVPRDLAAVLGALPTALLVLWIGAIWLRIPLDPAALEAFDAWLLGAGCAAAVAIAITGLVAAAFVPMAYCKYGCATGQLLRFVRSHGRADRFGKRDGVAAAIALTVLALHGAQDGVRAWLAGVTP